MDRIFYVSEGKGSCLSRGCDLSQTSNSQMDAYSRRATAHDIDAPSATRDINHMQVMYRVDNSTLIIRFEKRFELEPFEFDYDLLDIQMLHLVYWKQTGI